MKKRLDHALADAGLVSSRSQAESFIRLGKVEVNGRVQTKPGYFVDDSMKLRLLETEQYVSRAAYKLASVAELFQLDFRGATVLDVGSSTGGFTDYALRRGAAKSICVEVGTDQLHTSLRTDERIELHEQTDIRDFVMAKKPDIVLIDVSFISLRDILPAVKKLCSRTTLVVAMLKPQFESGSRSQHKGVIKNDKMRREILQQFEFWLKQHFVIKHKADSGVAGEKGNQERFYLLKAVSVA